MSKYTIHPWRQHSDLLQVRSQLYPSKTSSSSSTPPSPEEITILRQNAVSHILAWKLRSNLPHAVESSALLTSALLLLHHQTLSSSPQNPQTTSSISDFPIRATLSQAFTRFVTGFCDIGRSSSRLLTPPSMLEIARKIGLPGEFVELRHEATHEDVPSLKRLVGAAEGGLEWLWGKYWSRLPEEVVDGVGEGVEGGGVERVREVLKGFRSESKGALKRKRNAATTTTGGSGSGGSGGEEEKTTAKICLDLLGSTPQGMESLAQIFVQDKLLVPSKRDIGDPLSGAHLLWDPLLKALLTQQPHFLPSFIKTLRKTISDPSISPSPINVEKEALCMWLLHTTNPKKSWTGLPASELDCLRKELVKWCCMHPGYWSYFLGVGLIEGCGEEFKGVWEDVLEASRIGGGEEGFAGRTVVGGEGGRGSSPEVEDVDDDSAGEDNGTRRGWRRAKVASNLPIGVVR